MLRVAAIWEPLNLLMVATVAGRMLKEARVHQVWAMLVFCAPHALTLLLLTTNVEAYLRHRETLSVAVTAARTLAKALPLTGLLPYPHSAASYMQSGLDIFVEGLMASACEQMRSPLALLLRLAEGLVTGLLYVQLGSGGSSALVSVVYGVACHLACGCLTCLLDLRNRVLLDGSGVPGASSASGGGPGAPGGMGGMAAVRKKVL